MSQPVNLSSKGELALEHSALETTKNWKFEPATRDGEPLEAFDNLMFNFTSE